MSRSRLIRVDNSFAKMIDDEKIKMRSVVGKPVTGVEVTKMITVKMKSGMLSGSLVSCKKRGKRVLI